MAWLSKSRIAHTDETVVIERWRQQYFERNGALPPISSVLDQVASDLGVPAQDIDQILALTSLYNLFSALATYMGDTVGEKGIGDAISQVIESHGFQDDEIWNVLFARGARGLAIAEHLVDEQILNGALAQTVAEVLQEQGGVSTYVQLTSPGLDGEILEQRLFKAMFEMGLYYVIFGDGDEQDLADAVASVAPEVFSADPEQRIEGTGQVVWGVWSSAKGSAMALLPLLDGRDDASSLMRLIDRLKTLEPAWSVQIGKQEAYVPQECASIIDGSAFVLPALLDAGLPEHQRIIRRQLRSSILDGGFERVAPGLYKAVFPGSQGRTQLLWFFLAEKLEILSPIIQTAENEIPDSVSIHDFGRYTVDLFPPFIVLKISLDYSVGLEYMREEAKTLALYSDQCEAAWSGTDLL